MLARGMRDQSVVTDEDEAELLKRRPDARVEHVAEAGHSLQGDTPLELAPSCRAHQAAHQQAVRAQPHAIARSGSRGVGVAETGTVTVGERNRLTSHELEPVDTVVSKRLDRRFVNVAIQGGVEDLLDKSRFART